MPTQVVTHTPGPWTRESGERFKHDSSAGVRGPDGKYVAAALDFNRYDRDEEVEANARLLAAAPDLKAAVKLLVSWYDDDRDSSLLTRGIDQARAAIAKAEGR